MSVTTRNPLRVAGAFTYSGGPNTNELAVTNGGAVCVSVYSGGLINFGSGSTNLRPVVHSGGHAVYWSGPGRLNYVIPHQAISGVQGQVYDSAAVAASGVASVTAAILAIIPANTIGWNGSLGAGPFPIESPLPFSSGLALNLASGCAGVTLSFTPEVNPAIG